MSLAEESGLIVSNRVGKHGEELLANLAANTEDKKDYKLWYMDD